MEALKQNAVESYVEYQLTAHFGRLLEFVRNSKGEMAGREAAPVVRDFRDRWQGSLERMLQETGKQFPQAAVERELVQAIVTQLLLDYNKLLDMLGRQGPDGQALLKEAVSVNAIMYEIKSYMRQ